MYKKNALHRVISNMRAYSRVSILSFTIHLLSRIRTQNETFLLSRIRTQNETCGCTRSLGVGKKSVACGVAWGHGHELERLRKGAREWLSSSSATIRRWEGSSRSILATR